LSRANLNNTDLSGASLYHANLSGAYLCGADLRDVDAVGLNLAKAIYNQQTKWPAEIDPVTAGAVQERRPFKFLERFVETFIREKGSTQLDLKGE
jgi:uncharacterized protein YjbI with pentapeptide repeats